jgi:hypothetical protein
VGTCGAGGFPASTSALSASAPHATPLPHHRRPPRPPPRSRAERPSTAVGSVPTLAPPTLDDRLRLAITRHARTYIADLVTDNHGDGDDLRSIIDELHTEAVLGDRSEP